MGFLSRFQAKIHFLIDDFLLKNPTGAIASAGFFSVRFEVQHHTPSYHATIFPANFCDSAIRQTLTEILNVLERNGASAYAV